MTQHLGIPPRPWAGLESHLHAAPQSSALAPVLTRGAPARPELTAVALVLGYLARKRQCLAAG